MLHLLGREKELFTEDIENHKETGLYLDSKMKK